MVQMGPEKEMMQAMESLQDIVNEKGGINSPQHIDNLIKWMKDAQGFDVRIVYVCVVNATENSEILADFMNTGGWNCLAKWLEYFMTTDKHAAIREILKCFQKLPVSVKVLEREVGTENVPGKMIKKLKKHEDIDIKDLAEKIFDHWKQISEEAQLRRKARQAAKLAEKRKQEHKAEKDKEAKALKKMKASGPTLTSGFMENVFLTEEQKKEKKRDDKEKKKLKKKKNEEKQREMAKKENQPQTVFGGDLAILNGLGGSKDEEGESSEVQQFANLGNCSPPMHQSRGASSSSPPPSSEFPKREPKPGAKQVRWSDHTGHRPLEQVREIEIFFGERVNVNNEAYKRQMELEAFRIDETNLSNTGAPTNSEKLTLGDLMPKRQWRVPKKASCYLPEDKLKNVDMWSKDSEEKIVAAEKTARTLQKIYIQNQIPESATEPEPSPQTPVDVPRIPLDMRNENEKMDHSPAPVKSGGSANLTGIDMNLLSQINMADIQKVTNGPSHPELPPPPGHPSQSGGHPPSRNMYMPHQNSPPIDHRFGRAHDPTPPRHGDRRSPMNEGRYGRDSYRAAPYQQHPQRRDFNRPQHHDYRSNSGGPDRHRDRSPQHHYRRSRSPPYNQRGHGQYEHNRSRSPPSRGGSGNGGHRRNGSRSPPRGHPGPRHNDYRPHYHNRH